MAEKATKRQNYTQYASPQQDFVKGHTPLSLCERRFEEKGMKSTRQQSSCWRALVSILFIYGSAFPVTCAHGYRIGEVIDTDIRLDLDVSDALRSQMPLFGLDGSAQFSFGVMLDKSQTFSMTFEDGLWTIPSVPLKNRNQEYLQSLQVDFLYSKMGSLESVSNQPPVYSKDKPKQFRVNYKWTVEDAPHVTAAITLMMFAVFAACVYFVVEAFGMPTYGGSGNSASSGWSMGKEHST